MFVLSIIYMRRRKCNRTNTKLNIIDSSHLLIQLITWYHLMKKEWYFCFFKYHMNQLKYYEVLQIWLIYEVKHFLVLYLYHYLHFHNKNQQYLILWKLDMNQVLFRWNKKLNRMIPYIHHWSKLVIYSCRIWLSVTTSLTIQDYHRYPSSNSRLSCLR